MQVHTERLTKALDTRGVTQVVVTAYRPSAPRVEHPNARSRVVRVGVPIRRFRQLYGVAAAPRSRDSGGSTSSTSTSARISRSCRSRGGRRTDPARPSSRRCRLGINLYGVPDLEAFLEAALFVPTSLTADFNFPEWNYFGRGPVQLPAMSSP